jgi:guanylate kinase
MTAAEIAEWAAYLDVVAAEKRQAHAEAELAAQGEFDVVVVNSRLESACAELVSLLVGNAPEPA